MKVVLAGNGVLLPLSLLRLRLRWAIVISSGSATAQQSFILRYIRTGRGWESPLHSPIVPLDFVLLLLRAVLLLLLQKPKIGQ